MTTYLLIGMALTLGQVEPLSMPGSPVPTRLGAPSPLDLPSVLPNTSHTPFSPVASPPADSQPARSLNPLPAASTYGSVGYGVPLAPRSLSAATNQVPYYPYLAQPDNLAGNCPTSASNGTQGCFFERLWKAYCVEFYPKTDDKDEKKDDKTPEPEPAPRRGLPAPPGDSPPFPDSEYQGPLIGVSPSDTVYPLMQAIYGGPLGDQIKDTRIKAFGWVTVGGNFSTDKQSNSPTSYFIVPNRLEMDQAVLRFERELDTAQTDHMDWGFRITNLYGIDYRYTTAAGDFSDQLLKNNRLYGYDPLEYYGDLYVPWVAEGMTLRLGRYISPPDIEAQLAPDNYLATHSILFTYDDYTHTGLLTTVKLNDQWHVQAAIYAGGDIAPWSKYAIPTGFLGAKWVAADNMDSIYTCYNAINDAKFRSSGDEGHDNFNYIASTWSHTFCKEIRTATEAYFMWQRDALLGGTVSIGPPQSFGGGGGAGPLLPGMSLAYGAVNYTEFQLSKSDFLTVRNEWWRDEEGMRSGFASSYTSNTIGITHNFNAVLQVRPELGYYRSWDVPAFDLGTRRNMLMAAFDVTLRF